MSRTRVVWHYAAARRRRLASRAALLAWQHGHLQRVLAQAPHRYRFYAQMAPTTLDELPVLSKTDVLEHFVDLNERGLGLDECLAAARGAELGRDFSTSLHGLSVGLSSGTSGQQTAFLTAPAERDRWAGEVLAKALPRGLRSGARITLVLRASGPLYESVGGGRVSFRFVDLAQPAEQLVAAVQASAPTVLVAPPSVLLMVAGAGLERPPDRIFSVAEVLEPQDKTVIEGRLGVRVDQVYQAAEGFLGLSCARGRLHLNEDLMVVERQTIATPHTYQPGTTCFSPVITDLFRTSQAVLRRRLDDVLIPGQTPCDCGAATTVIDQIVGRSDDVWWLPRSSDTATLEPYFPDFVRAAVLAVPGVRDFRAVQSAARNLRLATDPDAAFAPAQAALVAALERAGLAPCTIEHADMAPQDPLLKVRRVRREWDTPAPAG